MPAREHGAVAGHRRRSLSVDDAWGTTCRAGRSGSITVVGEKIDGPGDDVTRRADRRADGAARPADSARSEWLRSTWSRVGTSNVTAALYGAVVSAGLLSVADEDVSPTPGLLAGTAGALVVFWLAHAYTQVLGTRPDNASGSLMSHMVHTAGHDFPLVLGGLPALALVGAAVLAGVRPDTAVMVVILITGVVLTVGGYVFGRRCGARGWDLVRETLTGSLLGAGILILEIFAH